MEAIKNNNLLLRFIIGITGAALILGAVYWNEWTFLVLVAGVAFFALREFYALIGNADATTGTITGLTLVGVTFIESKYEVGPVMYLVPLTLFYMLFLLELYQQGEAPFTKVAHTLLGIVYVGGTLSFFVSFGFVGGAYDWHIPFGIFLLIWASDTGAYFAGKAFGRTQLFERISPKKTWEGTVGGALFTLAAAGGMAHYFSQLNLWQWLVLAAIIIVFGSYGDLIESLLKRSRNKKDSGFLLPGHGGFLDRFDSLLYASPFIAVFLKVFV